MGLALVPLKVLVALTVLAALTAQNVVAERHQLHWTVQNKTVTRSCSTVTIATVNGKYPGPTIEIDEGDTVVVYVKSLINYPVTLHWHGIFQHFTNWADGPAYITQCPIQYGTNYTYEFTVEQSGTFFWHAHIDWLRETLHGAIVVHPKSKPPYGHVEKEYPIIFGEWWSKDPNYVETGYIDTLIPNTKGATISSTIGGHEGPLYGCSNVTQVFRIKTGKTYLLRLINAALDNEYYFKIENHTMTVVGADGNYLKNYTTDYVYLGPGQTTNVLLKATHTAGTFYCGISPARLIANNPPNITLAKFRYHKHKAAGDLVQPSFPSSTDETAIDTYLSNLKALNGYALPMTVDRDLIYVTGIATVACKASESCSVKAAGTVQNSTWDDPKNTSVLQAYFYNISDVYTTNIPDQPPSFDNFVGSTPDTHYDTGNRGTRVKFLNYNDTVQLVLQNVRAFGMVAHPFHLHGHDFYVVGSNYSNYDPDTDPQSFNLVDPPQFNTYPIPNGGWVAIRFAARNPGVWLLHCHYETHKTWGMETVFITKNGVGSSQTLPGPLHPIPQCT